jgi:histidine triad (HIT) family protein
MPQDPSCIFCRIIDRQIPASMILESPDLVAFLDINPVNPGHVLVVPRSHAANLIELEEDPAAAVGRVLPRVCRAVRRVTGADGLNIIVNLGPIAGQTVDHVHWHIIPRFHGDDVHWPWTHQRYETGEAERLREALAAELDQAHPPSNASIRQPG